MNTMREYLQIRLLLWLSHLEKIEESYWPRKCRKFGVGCSAGRDGLIRIMRKRSEEMKKIGRDLEEWNLTRS